MSGKKRWALLVGLFIVLLFFVGFTRYMTEQNGKQSHTESRAVAKYIENAAAEHFVINRNDVFWKDTLNQLVRKAAHFLEYMLVGIFLCAFLNMLTRKIGLSFLISAPVCMLLAYLDELRQEYIAGRSSAWLDVRVDTYGAVLGIVLTTILFAVYFKISKLNNEISLLEEELVRTREWNGAANPEQR